VHGKRQVLGGAVSGTLAGVGLNRAISVALEIGWTRLTAEGVPADPRLADLGLTPLVLASLTL
jgi:hypothetical protein